MKKDNQNLNKFTSDFIVSSRGQLDYPGMNTLIPKANGNITMKGVKQNVLGIDDLGNKKIMKPGKKYQFPGDSVYEIPLKKKGGEFKKGLVTNPKKTKKSLTSKKYSRSLSATNVLFTENSLFKKPKSRKNKVYNPKAKYYAEGGDTGCPNGQVWSKKDKRCIDLPVFGNSLNSGTFTKSTNLNDALDIKPFDPYSDFGKIKPKKIPVVEDSFLETLEKDINDFLENPLKTAAQVSERLKEKGEDPSDALRHSTAGALTAQTIANKTGNISFISNPLGYLGANIAGIGHELSTLSQAYLDDRPWSVKLQESLEDIYNNSAGANTIFSNKSEKDKINYLLELTRTNQLPDGYGEERPFRDNPKWTDPYNQKQYGGINKFDDGGTIYNVKGSKSNYKKINGKWQVDWNRSGKYQPLSKGDVKARTAILDKMAKPVYTPSPKIDPYAKIKSNSSDNTNLNLYQKEIPWNLTKKYQGDILAQNKKKNEDAINYRAKNTISNEDFDKENHISTEFPKNATASDYAQRVWEYATNPGTALEYALGEKSGKGPMPFNINQLKEQGVNVNSNSNLVGNMFNIINPLDDVESIRSGVSDIDKGNNSGYLNAGLGILGFLPGGDALKGFKKYGKDLVQTSKQAGKFQLPKYKTVYRAEHAGYNQVAKEGSVDGRWVANNPEEVKFYVDKLKDPGSGNVLSHSFGDQPVKIIQQRLPEYEIKNTFGAGMPEEARMMSMGRGEFTDTGLDDLLGFGTGSRFSRGQFNQHDINAMTTAPFLFNKNEGILDADLINKLRNQESFNFFSSGKNNVFNNKQGALDYLTSEQKLMENSNMFKKYLPFKQGGATNDYVNDLTPEEIQKYIDGGYIVEEIN